MGRRRWGKAGADVRRETGADDGDVNSGEGVWVRRVSVVLAGAKRRNADHSRILRKGPDRLLSGSSCTFTCSVLSEQIRPLPSDRSSRSAFRR